MSEYDKAHANVDRMDPLATFADWLEGQGWRLHRPATEFSAHRECVEADETVWVRLIFAHVGVDYDRYMQETKPMTVTVELPDGPA